VRVCDNFIIDGLCILFHKLTDFVWQMLQCYIIVSVLVCV